jgi:hypothetical protein
MKIQILAILACATVILQSPHVQAQSPNYPAGIPGQITTNPPFYTADDKTFVVPVGPDSSGKYTVYYTVATSDDTFSVTGDFENADSSVGSAFDEDNSTTYHKTVTYPDTTEGTSNSVTITIHSSNDGQPCTASIWRQHSYGLGLSPRCSYSQGMIALLSRSSISSLVTCFRWPTFADVAYRPSTSTIDKKVRFTVKLLKATNSTQMMRVADKK